MIKISPSVLASDFSRLEQEVQAMEEAGADMIHLDVMDGHFVPNISFGPPVIKSLRPKTKLYFDTHLMIQQPLDYIGAFAAAGSDMISFHVESGSDVGETLAAIKAHGRDAGLVLKPGTPVQAVYPWLDQIKMVLVMTVEPGFGGQKFMPEMCLKVLEIRQTALERGLDLDIQVDGGIDESTAPLAVSHGANVLVAGSSLFGKPDYRQALKDLRAACQ